MRKYSIAYTQQCWEGFAPIGGVIDAGEGFAPKISKRRFSSHRAAAAFAAADGWEGATSQIVRRLPNGRGWRIVSAPLKEYEEEISLSDAMSEWTEEEKARAMACAKEWANYHSMAHFWPAAGEFAGRNGGFYWSFAMLNCNGWSNEKPFRWVDLRELIG